MNKMLIIFIFLSCLSLPLSASADNEYYESIRTLDTLFMVIEGDSVEFKFIEQKVKFTHYFSPKLNRSFIVSDETGEVCNTYKGADLLSCFACGEKEVSEMCP